MKTLWLSMQHVASRLRGRILARYQQPATDAATETAARVAEADPEETCFKLSGNRELLAQFQTTTSGLIADFLADGNSYYLDAQLAFLKLLDASMNCEPYLTDDRGNPRVSSVEQFAAMVAEDISLGRYKTPHDIRSLLDDACRNFDEDVLLAVKIAQRYPAKFQIALRQKAA